MIKKFINSVHMWAVSGFVFKAVICLAILLALVAGDGSLHLVWGQK